VKNVKTASNGGNADDKPDKQDVKKINVKPLMPSKHLSTSGKDSSLKMGQFSIGMNGESPKEKQHRDSIQDILNQMKVDPNSLGNTVIEMLNYVVTDLPFSSIANGTRRATVNCFCTISNYFNII